MLPTLHRIILVIDTTRQTSIQSALGQLVVRSYRVAEQLLERRVRSSCSQNRWSFARYCAKEVLSILFVPCHRVLHRCRRHRHYGMSLVKDRIVAQVFIPLLLLVNID